MKLLERESELQMLAAALGAATAGEGHIALVSGEAGIGKSAFVEHFIASRAQKIRVLRGRCDSLAAPTPLGPLYDIAPQLGGALLGELQAKSPRAAVFAVMLGELRHLGPPTLLLIEDIHWADEATLDLIKFLGRRIAGTSALLVLTYRSDEVAGQQPLRLVLGELASSRAVVRIELPSLSLAAVRDLVADRPIDPGQLHQQTGGRSEFRSSAREGRYPAS